MMYTLVSLAAVFSIVTQRSSPQERCVKMLKTTARETMYTLDVKKIKNRRVQSFEEKAKQHAIGQTAH